jgi:hypothetical protein
MSQTERDEDEREALRLHAEWVELVEAMPAGPERDEQEAWGILEQKRADMWGGGPHRGMLEQRIAALRARRGA